MKKIESLQIKEQCYIEKLENGMTIMVIPKKGLKKYAIWGTHFGSIDNHFIMPQTGEEVFIPDGVAHFLEHKMFEQANGTNSLDTLMAMGVDANAYTTNDHTAYLIECTNHFEEALKELMNYVQNPYFTETNVEKEKGIIGQEINMYDDDPGSKLYMNALKCLYEKNPINIDIAGSIESISKITPDVLYKCYHTFYHPSNMVMVLCGDFVPEEIIQKVKIMLNTQQNQAEIKRIYPQEKPQIHQAYQEESMEVSVPIFMMGYKDNQYQENNKDTIIKKHIAIEILLNMIIGKSSSVYQQLYEQGILLAPPEMDYEFTNQYAHVLLSGTATQPEKVKQKIDETIEILIKNGIPNEDFERIKRKIYGDYTIEYNSVGDIARMFLADNFKQINSFDYIENYPTITKEYVEKTLKEVFKKENQIMSVVKPNHL